MSKIIPIILLALLLAQPAFGQAFSVQEVTDDLTAAVIEDAASGQQWRVARGDEIAGWRVAQIAKDHVTLVKKDGEGAALVMEVPVRGAGRLILQRPR